MPNGKPKRLNGVSYYDCFDRPCETAESTTPRLFPACQEQHGSRLGIQRRDEDDKAEDGDGEIFPTKIGNPFILNLAQRDEIEVLQFLFLLTLLTW